MEGIKYLDEEGNLICHLDGGWMSINKNNTVYLCSSCFKNFKHQRHVSRHKSKCFLAFHEGINRINKEAFKDVFKIINRIGGISKKVQCIDFIKTSENSFKSLDLITLIYVKNTKILGHLSFCLKEIRDKFMFSIEDFLLLNI